MKRYGHLIFVIVINNFFMHINAMEDRSQKNTMQVHKITIPLPLEKNDDYDSFNNLLIDNKIEKVSIFTRFNMNGKGTEYANNILSSLLITFEEEDNGKKGASIHIEFIEKIIREHLLKTNLMHLRKKMGNPSSSQFKLKFSPDGIHKSRFFQERNRFSLLQDKKKLSEKNKKLNETNKALESKNQELEKNNQNLGEINKKLEAINQNSEANNKKLQKNIEALQKHTTMLHRFCAFSGILCLVFGIYKFYPTLEKNMHNLHLPILFKNIN